jgi:hypothetical protein
MRISAEPLAYWIHPDVAGHVLDCVGASQDVIVKSRLPKSLPMRAAEFVCRALFECVHKFHQIAGVGYAFGEEMKMVRHETKAMERERMMRREAGKMSHRPAADGQIRENRAAISTTNSDEA